MSVLNAKFGQVIRDRRRQSELTQQQVAKRVGTSTPYVGHLEAGKRHPSDEIVTRLADAYGASAGEEIATALGATAARGRSAR